MIVRMAISLMVFFIAFHLISLTVRDGFIRIYRKGYKFKEANFPNSYIFLCRVEQDPLLNHSGEEGPIQLSRPPEDAPAGFILPVVRGSASCKTRCVRMVLPTIIIAEGGHLEVTSYAFFICFCITAILTETVLTE